MTPRSVPFGALRTALPCAAAKDPASMRPASRAPRSPFSRRALALLPILVFTLGGLQGCAGPVAVEGDDERWADELVSAPAAPPPSVDGWHGVALPGKQATQYARTVQSGRVAVSARAERSASMWRRTFDSPRLAVGEVSFSWWVPQVLQGANVADIEREDAAARVLFAFAGDASKLPLRTRMMFELAEALTGEKPPYATLMYVYETSAPVGSVIVNPRSDRIRKIVLDSGSDGLGRWRDHRRDLAADFRLAFGEEPGPLLAVALMTDSDNTRSVAEAWYGPVDLH
jgi:hypothetical protein